jgi:hypothetical protein
MFHRPYPRLDRARRQLDRHKFEVPPRPAPADDRRALPPVGEYRLSTGVIAASSSTGTASRAGNG